MKKKLLTLLALISLCDLVIARGGGGGGHGGGGGRGGGGRGGGGYHGGGRGGYGRGGYGRGGYGRGGYGGWGWGGFGLGLALTAPFWWSGPGYYGGNTYITNYNGWNLSDDGTLSNGTEQTNLSRADLKRTSSRLKEDLAEMKNKGASDSDIKQQESKIADVQRQIKKS